MPYINSICLCVTIRKWKGLAGNSSCIQPLIPTLHGAVLLQEPYCYGSRVEVCHTSLQDFAGGNLKEKAPEKREIKKPD